LALAHSRTIFPLFSACLIVPGAALSATAPDGPVAEVVITATQRETPLLDLPLSSSVFDAGRLAGANVSTLKEVTSLAPSLGVINSIGESFGQLLRVRGVATSGADIGLESAVGLTVDGVPLSRPNLAVLDLYGVARVEFLRGPQGTLFGKNTTAGVLNILTERPHFEPSFIVGTGASSRDGWQIRTSLNGGVVTDRLAARVDGLVGGEDGYVRTPDGRLYGGRDRAQFRGQALWTPTDDVDVRVIADWLYHDGTINGPVYRVVGPTGAIVNALSGTQLLSSARARDLTQIDGQGPRFEEAESAGFSGELNWKTAIGTVTTIAAHRSADVARSYDVDNSPADLANDPRDGERFHTSTFESRLQGTHGRLDYLFGVFAGRELIVSRDNFEVGSVFDAYANALAGGFVPAFTGLPAGENFPLGTGVFDVFRQRSDSLALFTHQIFALTERIDFTLGGRYTWEEKTLRADIESNNPGCSAAIDSYGPELIGVPAQLQGVLCIPNLDPRYDGAWRDRINEGNWSGTAAVSGRITENWSAYAHYSRGFKAGGYQLDRSGMDQLSPALGQVAFTEETADSYEAGLRGEADDGMWRIGASLFHTRFEDYQFSYFTGLNRRTQNVPELVTRGFEVEAAVRPISEFEMTFATSYQEVQFGESGFPTGLTQLEGTAPPLAPRWVVVGTASYARDLDTLGLKIFANADLRWQSRSNVGGSGTPSPDYMQNPYATVGARLGTGAEDGFWMVELWGRNLTDVRAWSILNSTTLQPGSISGYVTDPRTIGLTLTLSR